MANAAFQRSWTLANTLAFIGAYLPYTPLAHGFTGNHGHHMNGAQLMAHGVAMFLVGTIVAAAQRQVLRPYVEVAWWRVPVVAVAFVAAFWLGYYQPAPAWAPDLDLLYGFTVLGCGTWLGIFRSEPDRRWLVRIAPLAFTLACLLGQIAAILVAVGLSIPERMVQESAYVHATYFLIVAAVTGLIGGYGSGKLLARAARRNAS